MRGHGIGRKLASLLERQEQGEGGRPPVRETYSLEDRQQLDIYSDAQLAPGEQPPARESGQLCQQELHHSPDCQTCKSCHFCRQRTATRKAQCSECQLHWCPPCLATRFGEVASKLYRYPYWRCPVCRGLCNCSSQSCVRASRGLLPTGELASESRQLGHVSVAHYLIAGSMERYGAADADPHRQGGARRGPVHAAREGRHGPQAAAGAVPGLPIQQAAEAAADRAQEDAETEPEVEVEVDELAELVAEHGICLGLFDASPSPPDLALAGQSAEAAVPQPAVAGGASGAGGDAHVSPRPERGSVGMDLDTPSTSGRPADARPAPKLSWAHPAWTRERGSKLSAWLFAAGRQAPPVDATAQAGGGAAAAGGGGGPAAPAQAQAQAVPALGPAPAPRAPQAIDLGLGIKVYPRGAQPPGPAAAGGGSRPSHAAALAPAPAPALPAAQLGAPGAPGAGAPAQQQRLRVLGDCSNRRVLGQGPGQGPWKATGAGSGCGSYNQRLRWYARPPSAGPAAAKRRQELGGDEAREARPLYPRGMPHARPGNAPAAAGDVPMLEGAAVAAAAPLSPDRGQEREEEAGPDAHAPPPPVRDPGPEGAPFSELLVALDRAGRDLASRAGAAGGCAAAPGLWGRSWLNMVEGAMRQVRAQVTVASSVSAYRRGAAAAAVQDQPIRTLAQLRAAVDVLLLAAAELPSRADWRAEGERNRIACESAVELLLCEEPFANFDECDPEARLALVEGVLSLTRLAAARSRRDPDWRPTLDSCLRRLLQWLLAQDRTARQLAAAARQALIPMELRTAKQVGGLPILEDTTPAHLQPVAKAYEAALTKMVVRLEKLLRAPEGRGLALRLLDPDTKPQPALQLLQEDHAPPPDSKPAPPPLDPAAVPCLLPKLLLIQRAVLALAGRGKGLEIPPPGQQPAAGRSTLSSRLSSFKLHTVVERVVKWAAAGAQPDPLLASRGWTAEQREAAKAALSLLGTLYGMQYAEAGKDWADVEMDVAQLCRLQTKATTLCTVWQANGANPRQRGLVVSLLAQVVRSLAALERREPLVEALLPRASRDELLMQSGLLTTWFHAALDPANRVALADLTQELLLCTEARPFLLGTDTTTPAKLVAAAVRADSNGSVCAQLTSQLFSSLVAERRSMELGEMLKDAVLSWRGLQPSPDFAAAGPNRPSPRIEDLARSMLAHRAMAAVALAALEPCGKGWLAQHASRAPGWSGGFEAAQAPLRLLECVAEAMARDAAALVKWDGAPGAGVDPQEHLRLWCVRLAEESSAGLLPELVGVLAVSADAFADHDTTPSAKAPSVLQRCLSLVCLMVCDLPPTAPAHAETRQRLLLLVARAFATHLALPGAADASGSAAMPVQPPSCGDNLVGCVHRSLTGTLREHVKAGLTADHRPDDPLVRRTTNALAWLELLMGQEAVRERSTLERLLPPLLHLVVGALVEARQLLLRRGALLLDVEEAPQPQQPQPQPQQLQPQHASTSALSPSAQATQQLGQIWPQHGAQHGAQHAQQQQLWGQAALPQAQHAQQGAQHSPPYALIRQVLSTAAAVLAAAGGAGLLAPPGEAGATPHVSIARGADPMHLLRPADRHQLRAAAGLATGLLLRLCAECAAATLPLNSQGPALEPLRPAKPHEHGLALRLRLGPCLGVLRCVPAHELPDKAREGGVTADLDWAKDEGADGADGPLKTGGAALEVLSVMVQQAGPTGVAWSRPAGVSVMASVRAAVVAKLWSTELKSLAKDFLRVEGVVPPAPRQPAAAAAAPQPGGGARQGAHAVRVVAAPARPQVGERPQGLAPPAAGGAPPPQQQRERPPPQQQQRPGPPQQGQGAAQEGRQQPAVPAALPPPRDRRPDAPGPVPGPVPDHPRRRAEEPEGQGAKRARAESPPAVLLSAAPPGQRHAPGGQPDRQRPAAQAQRLPEGGRQLPPGAQPPPQPRERQHQQQQVRATSPTEAGGRGPQHGGQPRPQTAARHPSPDAAADASCSPAQATQVVTMHFCSSSPDPLPADVGEARLADAVRVSALAGLPLQQRPPLYARSSFLTPVDASSVVIILGDVTERQAARVFVRGPPDVLQALRQKAVVGIYGWRYTKPAGPPRACPINLDLDLQAQAGPDGPACGLVLAPNTPLARQLARQLELASQAANATTQAAGAGGAGRGGRSQRTAAGPGGGGRVGAGGGAGTGADPGRGGRPGAAAGGVAAGPGPTRAAGGAGPEVQGRGGPAGQAERHRHQRDAAGHQPKAQPPRAAVAGTQASAGVVPWRTSAAAAQAAGQGPAGVGAVAEAGAAGAAAQQPPVAPAAAALQPAWAGNPTALATAAGPAETAAAAAAAAAVPARAGLATQPQGPAEEPAAAVLAAGVAPPPLAELEVSPAAAVPPSPPRRLRLGLFMPVPGSEPQEEDGGPGAEPWAGVGPQGPDAGPQGAGEAALSQGAQPALGPMDRGPRAHAAADPHGASLALVHPVASSEIPQCGFAGAQGTWEGVGQEPMLVGEEGGGGEGKDGGEEEEDLFHVPATPLSQQGGAEDGVWAGQAGGGVWQPTPEEDSEGQAAGELEGLAR
ncbi:hypothetical protein HYH03_000948 [Edaphochlamys debaryana]|uniref:Zinc-finger domain-containing protein n=1 Tax=Edaphochlamys debaryana TaxID=47281 RepID=A0A836C5Q8_9CHLO|nr:hypothetical protein HYH03_000948 [Edaphochlamys debaryana]|eukprot:KAG2501130.1 hypothetical protein HYH03_000948 [Edaphochlamys debaryana]